MQWVDEMEDEKKKLKLNNNKKKIKTRVSQAWYQKLAVSARLWESSANRFLHFTPNYTEYPRSR